MALEFEKKKNYMSRYCFNKNKLELEYIRIGHVTSARMALKTLIFSKKIFGSLYNFKFFSDRKRSVHSGYLEYVTNGVKAILSLYLMYKICINVYYNISIRD